MSENYTKQINDLIQWFAERLPNLEQLKLTEAEYKIGVDSLKDYHAKLRDAAFIEWLTMRNYELSYNQVCNAFFAAAKQVGVLEIGA